MNASPPTGRLSLSSVSSPGGTTQAVQAVPSSATPALSPPHQAQTQAQTSIRSVSPACSQKMQQKMEARFDVMKDAPRCSFFEPPSSSPAVASNAPGFSPKGEPAIDTAASQSTPDVRGRSSEDSQKNSRASSRGRSPEEDRREGRASLSYYTPLRGDVLVGNRSDAVPSSSSAAPRPVPGDILEEVRRNSQASQRSLGASPPPSESTVGPPAPLPSPTLEGADSQEIPESSQASPNSITASPPPGADERRPSSELRISDDGQADVPASSSTAPAPTGAVVEERQRHSQASQNVVEIPACPPIVSTTSPPAPSSEGLPYEPYLSAQSSSSTPADPTARSNATDSPTVAAIRETPLAEGASTLSPPGAITDVAPTLSADKQAFSSTAALDAPDLVSSSSTAALDAPGLSSIEAVDQPPRDQPPRWLTNPPLLEDGDVNAEEEIEALQRIVGDFTKELGVLEAFAGIDGDRGNEDERQDPASGDAVSAAEERRLSLGRDDLAVEQREFQAWIEGVSSAAATLLDARDRSAIGQSGS